MYKYCMFLCPLVFFLSTINIYPQRSVTDFSYIKLSCSLVKNQSNDGLYNYWNKKKGYEAYVETPFYGGNILAGIRLLPFSGKTPSLYDFTSEYYYIGWGKDLNIFNWLAAFVGVKTGGFAMNFSDNSLSAYQKEETEMAAGLTGRLSINVLPEVYLNLSADYSRVFTHKRIELFLLAGGVSYKFNTPAWLKEFLR